MLVIRNLEFIQYKYLIFLQNIWQPLIFSQVCWGGALLLNILTTGLHCLLWQEEKRIEIYYANKIVMENASRRWA